MLLFRKGRRRALTLDEIARLVEPVAEGYGVDKIYVFGSYARGEALPDSDVDLLVSPGEVRGIRIGGLYRDLSAVLGRKIDLVTDRADPDFIRMIRKDLVLVYEN